MICGCPIIIDKVFRSDTIWTITVPSSENNRFIVTLPTTNWNIEFSWCHISFHGTNSGITSKRWRRSFEWYWLRSFSQLKSGICSYNTYNIVSFSCKSTFFNNEFSWILVKSIGRKGQIRHYGPSNTYILQVSGIIVIKF